MDVAAFCGQARVLVVAGKGGVGKTTVTATVASVAARVGRPTMIIEVDGKSGLPALFGQAGALSYQPRVLQPAAGTNAAIEARTLTPDDALVEYLENHGMRRVLRRLSSTGALDVVATAVPGIKDILVLGKVKQLERAAGEELLIVDAPAAGHAITFLGAARALMETASVGPIRAQASEVIDLLSDPARCQVILVSLPEETPVNELVETAFHLEDRAGVTLAPVVVNGVWPELDLPPVDALRPMDLKTDDMDRVAEAAAFRAQRQEVQAEQIHRLCAALPLAQVHLPYLFTTELGPPEVQQLAVAMERGIRDLAPATSS